MALTGYGPRVWIVEGRPKAGGEWMAEYMGPIEEVAKQILQDRRGRYPEYEWRIRQLPPEEPEPE